MIVFPAIDIRGGKCVRLTQGRFDQQTVYAEDPERVADAFIDKGASWLHVVDLDGARTGDAKNLEIIERIAKKNVNVELGGGIRSLADIQRRIDAGVSRCIIGTAALEHPQMVRDAVVRFGDCIAVGIDARDGLVATHGWEQVSQKSALDFAKQMKQMGVETVIHTDISKDGMQSGPNLSASLALQKETGLHVIVSGGISSLADVQAVKEQNLYGVITGKAIYDGNLDIAAALALSD